MKSIKKMVGASVKFVFVVLFWWVKFLLMCSLGLCILLAMFWVGSMETLRNVVASDAFAKVFLITLASLIALAVAAVCEENGYFRVRRRRNNKTVAVQRVETGNPYQSPLYTQWD